MTSILIEPQAPGFDAATFKSYTQWGKVVQAGGQWVSLYLGGTFGVDQAAIEGAWAVGLGVMLNYERSERAALSGYSMGVTHANDAMRQATGMAFQGEAPLVFSGADFGVTADQMPTVLDYHRALVDTYTLGAGGAYGPKSVLEQLAAADWWPEDWPLWHWGGDGTVHYPWAWAKQGPGTSYYNQTIGLQVDNNTLLKPMRFWSGYGEDKTDPPEGDMTQFYLFPCTDDPAVFYGLFDGKQIHTVEWIDGETAAHYRADGVPELPDVNRYSFVRGLLLGALPPGWSVSQFRRVVDASQGPVGPPGPPGPQGPKPTGSFPATVTIS